MKSFMVKKVKCSVFNISTLFWWHSEVTEPGSVEAVNYTKSDS